jgi:exopolysaccharide production protein ExoZ
LKLEMLFYVLIAIALLLRRSVVRFVSAALLLGFASSFLPDAHRLPFDLPEFSYLIDFFFGICLAWWYAVPRRSLPVWLLCTVAALALAMLMTLGGQDSYRYLHWGLPAFVLVGASIELEPWLASILPLWLLLVGDASYSIYLSHTFVLPLVARLLLSGPAWCRNQLAVSGICLAVSCFVGIAIYWLLEDPINRYFHVRRRSATAVA